MLEIIQIPTFLTINLPMIQTLAVVEDTGVNKALATLFITVNH